MILIIEEWWLKNELLSYSIFSFINVAYNLLLYNIY